MRGAGAGGAGQSRRVAPLSQADRRVAPLRDAHAVPERAALPRRAALRDGLDRRAPAPPRHGRGHERRWKRLRRRPHGLWRHVRRHHDQCVGLRGLRCRVPAWGHLRHGNVRLPRGPRPMWQRLLRPPDGGFALRQLRHGVLCGSDLCRRGLFVQRRARGLWWHLRGHPDERESVRRLLDRVCGR